LIPLCHMKSEIAGHLVFLKNSEKGLKSLLLGIAFCAQVAEHNVLRTGTALFSNMIKKPGGFFVLHMKPTVVVGMFLEKLRIVIRLHKEKICVDAMFKEALPIVEIGHNDDLSAKPPLSGVDDEPKIGSVGAVRDGYGVEEKFTHPEGTV